jgi:hypothetical protein
MSFSPLTRWLREGRTARPGPKARLRVEAMEDRRTPAASLLSTNFSLTDGANDDSQLVAVASRGRYAIVTSSATDVVSGQVDTAGTNDLFWLDTLTGERKLVTAAAGSNGKIATGQVGQAVISADGLNVAFVSSVTVSTYDTNYTPAADAGSITDDVFLWNATTGTTILASREANNRAIGQSTGSANPAISADGAFVAFTSTRPTSSVSLGGGQDQTATADVFRYERAGNFVGVVTNANGNDAFGLYGDVQVDSLGRYMDSGGTIFAVVSPISADKVNTGSVPTPAQLKNVFDVWQINLISTTNVPVNTLVSSVAGDFTRSLSSAGGRVTSAILAPDNPQAILFTAVAKSGAKNELVTGYQNSNGGTPDLYFRLMNSSGGESTILVSAAAGSTNIGGNSNLDETVGSYVVSTDGGRVAFTSLATNLVPAVTDVNGANDVFTWAYTNRTVAFASATPAGTASGNGASSNPAVSADGKFVAFETLATNVTTSADANTVSDVVLRNLSAGTSTLASGAANGSGASNGRSSGPELLGSGAGTSVAFNSFSTNLDPLFPALSFGDERVYSVAVPIETSPADRVAVVSGTRAAAASFVTFGNNGSLTVGDKFTPFPGFSGELRVAVGDVDGDGTLDLIAGSGPGGGPRVSIISGANGTTIRTFFAYEPTFEGGVYVAAADFNADGKADVVVGADAGGGPRVRVFSAGNPLVSLGDFFVYESTFRGGVRVATGDVNGDGRPEIITGAGVGGGPRVTVTDGTTLGTTYTRLADFFAFESSLRNGVNVSGGDLNNDGKADLGIGAGPGGGPRITVFSGASVITGTPFPTQLLNFFAFDPTQRYGVRVAIKNIDGDETADLITAPGTGGQNRIRTFSGGKISSPTVPLLIEDVLLYGDAGSRLGAWVG